MKKKITKKEIVKLLLNQNLEEGNEEELMDSLVKEPVAIDIIKEDEESKSFGERLADKLTKVAGSWSFLLCFILFLIVWIILNLYAFESIDPYPFILLNLLLSCISAVQAPIIMMSQNRAAKKDSIRSKNDYKTDLKSELILEDLHEKMEKIIANQNKILKKLEETDNK
mgnify:CR=1 FL=1